jgi:hypothetical protein
LLDGGQDAGDLGHWRHRKGEWLGGAPSLNPRSGVRNLCPADASNLLTRQVLFAIEEVIDEYTIRVATSPRLLRHAARHRAVAGPTLQRRRYAARGESENRSKEFKCDLAMDRLSDHRFLANYFRLYLHAAALNLLVRLRRFIAEPLPALTPQAETASPTSHPAEAARPADETCVPMEALTGAERQRHFRLRRQRDPLGEGQPCTWRTLLIKVVAEVVVSTRRIVVRLSSSWPHLGWYHRVCERVRGVVPTTVPHPSG